MVEYNVRVYENLTEWRNQKGEFHREDGPALEYRDGLKYWYVNGQIHRLDGPAVECPNGDQEWWIEGVKYSKEEFDEKIKQINNSCEGKIVEIDGIKYQLAKV